MNRIPAAFLIAVLALAVSGAARAQDAQLPEGGTEQALQQIQSAEVAPEELAVARNLVELSGTSRAFDELLPNIADQAKNSFIRANPQMQLGIIEVVDRIALTLVSRRPQLDDMLARIWAVGFTHEELEELQAFYSSETGKKFASIQPELLGVQMGAAQQWSQSVSRELTEKVSAELRAAMAAEEERLTGGTATGESQEPAPAPAQ